MNKRILSTIEFTIATIAFVIIAVNSKQNTVINKRLDSLEQKIEKDGTYIRQLKDTTLNK